MSIFNFPSKNSNKKGPKKRGTGQSLNMEKHLNEFAKEVNQYAAAYKAEKNSVYRSFKRKMEQAKRK